MYLLIITDLSKGIQHRSSTCSLSIHYDYSLFDGGPSFIKQNELERNPPWLHQDLFQTFNYAASAFHAASSLIKDGFNNASLLQLTDNVFPNKELRHHHCRVGDNVLNKHYFFPLHRKLTGQHISRS